MKRFGVLLLILVLVLGLCLYGPRLLKKVGADLGGFSGGSDYGGGSSDWGGGSSWSSGSDWGGGSSSWGSGSDDHVF